MKRNKKHGKGDIQRPVDKEEYDRNYERIFGKKEEKEDTIIFPVAVANPPKIAKIIEPID